ncbi:MAG: anthranilate synthase component I family protein [Crocinitomicaceae bacterium]
MMDLVTNKMDSHDLEFQLNFPGFKCYSNEFKAILEITEKSDLNAVHPFLNQHKGELILCFFSYEMKAILHDLPSSNQAISTFPKAIFAVPKTSSKESFQEGNSTFYPSEIDLKFPSFEHYDRQFSKIQEHIQRGDIYETNFCIAPQLNGKIDPYQSYLNLTKNNRAPFNGFIRFGNQFLMCCSPERFMKKEGMKLISQPIKGTIRRGANHVEDELLMQQLKSDPKETAENIMIVDLVRNDLSQLAERNSVKVEQLNQVESFKTVHQLVSTITCKLRENINFLDILKATFPMGSMTGAPKRRAMEIMEELEDFQRGLYSGSIGYIDGEGNFDFNVVIRSIVYDGTAEVASFPVGSAITFKSESAKEYEECKLKAKSMIKSLTRDGKS